MPWDMHRLTVAEWRLITESGQDADASRPGELPDGWEQLPGEGV